MRRILSAAAILCLLAACGPAGSVTTATPHFLSRGAAAYVTSAAIHSWGWNNVGQLGDGNTADVSTPATVGTIPGLSAMTGGGAHGLALGTGGTVYAWGWNKYGELGDGTTAGPQKCSLGAGCSTSPIQVSGLSGIVAVAGGDEHSVALSSAGAVWAWGNNEYGELGTGKITTTGCQCIDVPVKSLATTGVIAIAGGGRYTLALRRGGTVLAWGNDADGQLGNGTKTNSAKPIQVKNLTGVIAISAGYFHGLALTSSGTVYAWGLNSSGQLGNGTTTNSSVPVQVSGLTHITAISGGGAYSMALRSDGTVWTWGDNKYGELGDGTNVNRDVPVQATGLSGIAHVDAAHKHGLAADGAGNVWAWGDNQYGELGDGTTTSSTVPVHVSALSGVTSFGSGDQFSLAF